MTSVRPEDSWPEHPDGASYHDETNLIDWLEGFRGHGWNVAAVPPPPFPFSDGPWPRDRYGPPGTVWLFDESALIASVIGVPEFVGRFALFRSLRKLGVQAGAGPVWLWRVPDPSAQPKGPDMTFRYLRVTVAGKIGTVEEVAHVLNFRPLTNPDGDMTPAQIQSFADKVRDQWATFVNGGGPPTVTSLLSSSLTYTEVRASYLEQGAAATVTTVPGRKGPRKVFHYPKAVYLQPTVYSQFATNAVRGSGSSGSMPWEVACALTLGTGLRGPRNRGRLYLGPLDQSCMGSQGLFSGNVDALAPAFANNFIKPLQVSSGQQLMVVSRAYATALAVTQVSVGHVPDSQRRRRRKQPETRTAPTASV